MLDYRAHKLYWLLCQPFRLVSLALFGVSTVVGIIIGYQFSYNPFVKILISYVSAELIAVVFYLLVFVPAQWLLIKAFFWLIDIVPAHGADLEEAHAIVLTGRAFELTKKLENAIENWTYEDSRELTSLLPWRARLFPIRERMQRTAAELQQRYYETGQQPSELGQAGIKKLREQLPGGKPGWIEIAIVNPFSFFAMLRLAIIAFVVGGNFFN